MTDRKTPDRPVSRSLDPELEELELELLLTGVSRRYGYEFRGYAPEMIRRRVRRAMAVARVGTISELQARVLHDPQALDRFVAAMSVHVTGFFRDPPFFRALREQVVPVLRTYPFVRIWVAGCSTGEEAWSVAMLVDEAGMYDRCRIYATDFSHDLLKRARAAVYPRVGFAELAERYVGSGGAADLERWLEPRSTEEQPDTVGVRDRLRQNVVFSHHNLVSDASFNEFQLILCRNVLIYFEPPLRARALQLMHQSLRRFGYLGVGERESLAHTVLSPDYETLAPSLFRRLR